MSKQVSKYAESARSSADEIQSLNILLSNAVELNTLINSTANIVLILNEYRQIVYMSDRTISKLNVSSLVDKLGLRPGELLGCTKSRNETGGCGTNVNCKFCGAVNAILESQVAKISVEKETTITIEEDDRYSTLEFRVVATPYAFRDHKLTILSLHEIGATRRKEVYERIFFHDVLNASGSLEGILNLLQSRIETKKEKELVSIAIDLCNQISEEIQSHRQLVFAEEGMLKVHPIKMNSLEVLMNIVNQISNHDVAENKILEIDANTEDVEFVSDRTLLNRVLTNMIKNALEATDVHGLVSVGCSINEKKVRFWVKNKQVIPQEVQMQLFSRSFSTKGKGRGLGTYSMKLIGGKYLNAEVDFVSNDNVGTKFHIELPFKL